MAQVERYTATAPVGVNFSLEPSQRAPDLWDDALNISFDNGSTGKAQGIEQRVDAEFTLGGTAVIELVLPYKFNEEYRYAYFTSDGHVYSANTVGAAHTDISPDGVGLQPDLNYKWQGSTINGVAYASKGVPFYYDPTPEAGFDDGRMRAFTNFPTDLKLVNLRTFGNYLVGLGTEEGAAGLQENKLWHSSAVNDTDVGQVEWEPTTTNDANWVYLGGEGGALVDGLELRNDFIVYRERTAHMMSWDGSDNIFSYRQIFNGFGLVSRNSVVEINSKHFCFGVSDVYMHDGATKESIADSVVREKLYGELDPLYTGNSFVVADYKRKKVWVCIPEISERDNNPNGTCTGAYIYDWKENSWSYRKVPNVTCGSYSTLGIASLADSWSKQSGSWSVQSGSWLASSFNPAEWGWLMGGQKIGPTVAHFSNGFSDGFPNTENADSEQFFNAIYNDTENKTYLGEEYEATVTKSWIPLGDDNSYKRICLVHPIVRGQGELLFDVGFSDYINGSVNWKTGYSYNTEFRGNKPVRVRVNGRYFHIRFTIPVGSGVEINGYNLEYTQGGKL